MTSSTNKLMRKGKPYFVGEISKGEPPCPNCLKRDVLPSALPYVWYCANCLEQFRIEANG